MYKAYLIRLKLENISEDRHAEKLTSIINKKTIRSHLDKLIREFNILPEERTPWSIVKHVVKTLFWATVYLAFSYLTITSSFEVIQQYHDDQTTTNMKVIINNNVTSLPNMTICLNINTSTLFNISSSSSFNYTSAWSQFFEETISPEGIFKLNKSHVYDDKVYLSLLKYLAVIYEAERAWQPGLTQISTFHSNKSDDWIALKEVLLPNIERFNITLEHLKGIFDGKLCSLPTFSTGRFSLNSLVNLVYQLNSKTECIAENKISFIGMNTICFRLIGYQNYLRQLGTTEFIYLNLYQNIKNPAYFKEFTIDIGSESRSTPRRATTRNETYGYYYNRFPSKVDSKLDIGIKALYRKLPNVKGDVQCSSDTTREECENKCLRRWIRTHCHCSPITFNLTKDMSSYRNCTVDDYSICLKKYTENATYLCTNKCVPLCEQWHYEYALTSSYNAITCQVEISLKTFDYIIIEQIFTWNSFEEFIGALGGALGIWLGLDFVIITEFIVKLVTKLIKKILLRKGHNLEEEKHEDSANTKNREENVENGISLSNKNGIRRARNQKNDEENESEVAGTSIRQINESEKQRTSRKKRESYRLEEKRVQQRRRRSNKNNRVDSAIIIHGKMKNMNVRDGRQRNNKVNITENSDAVQEESTAHANYSSARSSFLQKMLLLLLNGDVPTNKSVLYLRVVKKLFWAAIYLVGSVFTTFWCVDLINLYLADEAVYFSSLIVNRTVSLPPPSLCITYSNNLHYEGNNNISNAFVNYFGQTDIDRATFTQISNRTAWPESFVSVGLLYFSVLAASEMSYTDFSFISYYEKQLYSSGGEDTLLRNDLNKSLNDILLPKLLEWNITANELRQKLGAELARMVGLKITFTNKSGSTDIVNETSFHTAAITDNLFCFSLTHAVNFTDPDDTLEFSIKKASYPQLLTGWSWNGYIIFSDYLLEPRSAQFSIGEDYVATFDSDNFLVEFGYETRISISVQGLYASRPAMKGVKYCSPNATKSYCRAQCRIKLIEKLCSCSPTYWDKMIQPNSSFKECTFDRYMECLNFNASDDLACKDSCLPFCTASYYKSELTKNSLSYKFIIMDDAVVRFSLKNYIYVSIEEKPIFTFSNLLIKV